MTATALLYYCVLSIKEICSFHIGCAESKRKRKHSECLPYVVCIFFARKSHMIAYSKGFLTGKTHKARYHINGLLAVTVRQSVIEEECRHLFPLTRFFVLHVSCASCVDVDLAYIVK